MSGDEAISWMIATYGESPEDARSTLGIFALLLRQNSLPKAGRDFLANQLEAIAHGQNPGVLIPKRKRRKSRSDIQLLAEVEREKMKLGASHGDMDRVYNRVADRHKSLKASSLKKVCSQGRSQIRDAFRKAIDGGMGQDKALALFSNHLLLPVAAVKKLLL